MAVIPDVFEIVIKGDAIVMTTQALSDTITMARINLDSDQAAALTRLINLADGQEDLKVEIKLNP